MRISAVLGLAFVVFLIVPAAFPDTTSYAEKRILTSNAAGLRAPHSHDWSSDQAAKLYSKLDEHLSFFAPDNRFSTLVVVRERDGKEVFRSGVPALSVLKVTDDGRYIIGLSNIKLANPFQAVVFDSRGDLLLARRVGAYESCMSKSKLSKLFDQFPRARKVLEPRVRDDGSGVRIDYEFYGVPDSIEELAWDVLWANRCRSDLSSAIEESTTNYVAWYNREDPEPWVREGQNGAELIIRGLDGAAIVILLSGG